jgi:hypothetical protein
VVELLSLLIAPMIIGLSSIVECWAALSVFIVAMQALLVLIFIGVIVIIAMVWHGYMGGCME